MVCPFRFMSVHLQMCRWSTRVLSCKGPAGQKLTITAIEGKWSARLKGDSCQARQTSSEDYVVLAWRTHIRAGGISSDLAWPAVTKKKDLSQKGFILQPTRSDYQRHLMGRRNLRRNMLQKLPIFTIQWTYNDIYTADVYHNIVTLGSPDRLRCVPFLILFSPLLRWKQAHHKARESTAGENNLWQKQPSTTKVLPPPTFAPPGGFPRCAPAHGLCQRMPTLSAPQSPSSTSSYSPSWVTFRDPTHKSRVAVNSTKPSRLTSGSPAQTGPMNQSLDGHE